MGIDFIRKIIIISCHADRQHKSFNKNSDAYFSAIFHQEADSLVAGGNRIQLPSVITTKFCQSNKIYKQTH